MYKKDNIYYNGGSITYRISEHKIFSGVPSIQQLQDWGFEEVITPQPTEGELIEQAKQQKLNELEAYDNSPNVNSFSVGGVTMWLDASMRQQLRLSIEAYQSQGIEQVSKWFNGVQYTFPTSVWLQMLNAVEVYASEALNTTESHKAAINSLTSIEDINEYDFTLNYPNKIEL